MNQLLNMLDIRSFASLWYWLLLAAVWAWVGRGALGIPSDLAAAVRRRARRAKGAETDQPHPDSILLLDWLSLTLPRWRIGSGDGIVLAAVGSFVFSALAVLGFPLRQELARALFLMLAPLAVLGLLRLRLAGGLREVLTGALTGALDPDAAAALAARRLGRHALVTTCLSVVAVVVTAMVGTLWNIQHMPLLGSAP